MAESVESPEHIEHEKSELVTSEGSGNFQEKEREKVVVGNIYTGKVLKIKPFGAIVSLPGSAPGLVHISQIAAGYVQNVEDVLEIGDEVSVRVLSQDAASGKISLSMKDVPQLGYDEDDPDGYGPRYIPSPPVVTAAAAAAFEEKFKAWQKVSNERIAGLNKRNKRR
ncbi:MAG: S1 RNA-binding domain-containing protein [Defluviitaleaceae bacterium]|nr:S1 RNA-binding domain-containing protein [Defluviitaleaceae bacterium]